MFDSILRKKLCKLSFYVKLCNLSLPPLPKFSGSVTVSMLVISAVIPHLCYMVEEKYNLE